MKTHPPDDGAGAGAATSPRRRIRIAGGGLAALRRRVRDLRSRQRRRASARRSQPVRERLPTFRAHNEQAMAHAAIAFAKAQRRRRMMACTTSIGPGRHQHGDGRGARARQPPARAAAAGRHVRQPPARPGAAAARGLRRPDGDGQRLLASGLAVLGSHHAAGATARVAAAGDRRCCSIRPIAARRRSRCRRTCRRRPATIPQTSSPSACTTSSRPRAGSRASSRARRQRLMRAARRRSIVAGGGVHYAGAQDALAAFAAAPRHPGRRDAGRQGRAAPGITPATSARSGVTGTSAANALAAQADLVLAHRHAAAGFHDRLGQAVRRSDARLVAVNVGRHDAIKRGGLAVRGDALRGLAELARRPRGLAGGRGLARARARAGRRVGRGGATTATRAGAGLPTTRRCSASSMRAPARARRWCAPPAGCPANCTSCGARPEPSGYHVEYGYSCMGYEIAGGLGVKMAQPGRDGRSSWSATAAI